jgi:hypothetical protein
LSRSVPTIVSSPSNVKNVTGAFLALICEARGYPIPTVEWTWTRVDGKTIYLPSKFCILVEINNLFVGYYTHM